jgi:hypothetical protein
MVNADYVKVSAQEIIIRFRALMANVAPPLQDQNDPPVQTASSTVPVVVSSAQSILPTQVSSAFATTRANIYAETNNFSLHEQQRITNWDHRSAYVFNNASAYLFLVQLHTTSTRPLQLNDKILFLQPAQHPFQPADPWGTLFLQR